MKLCFEIIIIVLLSKYVISETTTTEEDSSSGEGETELTEGPSEEVKMDIVTKFLRIVDEYDKNKESCKPGTEFSLEGGQVEEQYGVRRFKDLAMMAVNRANFLTRIWQRGSKALLESEFFFYTQVRSLVEENPDIFAAGNCYDYKEFKNYDLFCPYAHRYVDEPDKIVVKDLSIGYYYVSNGTEYEWFSKIREKANMKVQNGDYEMNDGYEIIRRDQTSAYDKRNVSHIKSVYEDGTWSKPYFDCGGGNIWMITYTLPFFGYDPDNGTYHFKGTSGIDIDLQKVDIDQCPGDRNTNVFADSAKCKKKTTQCVPILGQGFSRGSYQCVCKDGFYFPDTSSVQQYFNGTEIEAQYDKKMQDNPMDNYYDSSFSCLPCAPGCDKCVDDKPCIISLHWDQRRAILGLNSLVMVWIFVLMWFTINYRDVKVLKAASPMLLRIILLGALLLYCPMIVNYFEPTILTCSLRLWLRELGFSISYGALLLKTWRISVVFRVRSAARIKISDMDLIKRLALIVLIFVIYLSIRMAVGRPYITKGVHTSGLYAFQCSWDVWDYCGAIGELLFLIWGIRLCIVVRKAPSEFNESRFISWAIYNETLLSVFLNVTMFFLQEPANPDLLYLVVFIHTQLTTTVTLAFLFGSKAYVVYKYSDKESCPTAMSRGSKYMAAPKSQGGGTMLSNLDSSGNTTTFLLEECQQNGGIEKDVQEEFKRLYMQIETLKLKNMKLGNPHLTNKLSAMADLAMKEEPPDDSTPSTPNLNTNINGKRVVINLDDFKDATAL
ncbi:unnamed protein product [Owenia fusiformis]|uniref:G-protein coupled receptors family 3 profile domain-containing protein n=1 Tax=Owenia fusiformis TaxID=6347 RepID=A0A8S4NEJ6_OWEFU|nr:unnamed protein product [Owenia fusiformis]